MKHGKRINEQATMGFKVNKYTKEWLGQAVKYLNKNKLKVKTTDYSC